MTNEKQQNRKTFIDCYRIGRSLEYMDRYDQEQAWKKLNSAIQRKRLHRRISYMSSVAAMVAIAFTSFYLWHGEDQAPAEKLADAQETVGQSGRPGVILSLSDGRRIDLSAREGKIGAGEEVVNHPENKQLFYAADQGGEKISRMNRLDVPQGAEYHLVLSDGTRVWMNSKSELSYPVAFGENVRRVRLSGEAYFEVTKDSVRPFIVEVDRGFEVKVLGTHFNIKAYDTDDSYETTLVEGKVQVSQGHKTKITLEPSEQMVIGKDGRHEVRVVNTSYYTAWHEGWFYFNDESLEQVLIMIGRWYDVDFVFAKENLKEIAVTGKLKRFENLSVIMKMLERTTGTELILENRIVKVDKKK